MKKLLLAILIIILALLAWPGVVLAETNIRALLSTANRQSCTVANGSYILRDNGLAGRDLLSLSFGDTLEIDLSGSIITVKHNGAKLAESSGPITLLPQGDTSRFRLEGKEYRGLLTLERNGINLFAINVLDLELYLYGVLGPEMGAGAPAEALKAQAVASRSIALAMRSGAKAYDVTNDTRTQVYQGYSAESAAVLAAVDATFGQILCYPGTNGQRQFLTAYYHANSGGQTEKPENVWGFAGSEPLAPAPSPGDSQDTANYQWKLSLTPSQAVSLANKYSGTDIGDFREIVLDKTGLDGKPTVSGRATRMEIIGSKGKATATYNNIRTLLGGIKSNLIEITGSLAIFIRDAGGQNQGVGDVSGLRVIDGNGKISAVNGNGESYYLRTAGGLQEVSKKAPTGDIMISGRGWGHGLGMSQAGAIAMAKAGSSYKEILAHYYCQNPTVYLGDL
ncbi:MAG: SpoIID/LytB domain-containing protein [Clostridiales bacterium]|nr:SpoIID/LytB domain-containing protein [Clostridiales bacterium]